jgi:glycosyltransferase involved in cell wall biosynthesis
MTVLVAHNHYQEPGGEDQVFAAEGALLQSRGNRVIRYEEYSARIRNKNLISVGFDTVWSRSSYRKLEEIVRIQQPDVVHFHNTFPLISPSAYYAIGSQGTAVVQTLHNYRLLCVGANFFRKDLVCQECLQHGSPWPGVAHGCYRNSRVASLAVASMLSFHRVRGTFRERVDVFIALSPFAREQFVQDGIPGHKTVVKSNFVERDPRIEPNPGEGALFVGRLVEEKGVRTLLDAWARLSQIPLRILGSGRLAGFRSHPDVTWVGQQSHDEVIAEMKQARVLIFPSLWYEMAPLTILEAFACGLPVIASDLGAMRELVEDHRTGLLFRPGDAEDLATKVRWAFEHPAELQVMRAAARREFEEKYTAERNYKMLINIYEMAIENARRRRSKTQNAGINSGTAS